MLHVPTPHSVANLICLCMGLHNFPFFLLCFSMWVLSLLFFLGSISKKYTLLFILFLFNFFLNLQTFCNSILSMLFSLSYTQWLCSSCENMLFLWFYVKIYLFLWYCSDLFFCAIFLYLIFFLYAFRFCILHLFEIALFFSFTVERNWLLVVHLLCNWNRWSYL